MFITRLEKADAGGEKEEIQNLARSSAKSVGKGRVVLGV